jgi:C-terminal processing protease CtpA/Prc
MKKKFGCILFAAAAVMLSGCVNEEFGGLGIEVPTRHEQVSKTNPFMIVSVFKNGPAESAGLRTGDSIITIDGRPLEGLYEDYIVKNLLRGKISTPVTIEIERGKGSEKKNMLFRLSRVRIVLQE